MTAEKPEGDVARLLLRLRNDWHEEGWIWPSVDAMYQAAETIESQATRIATLSEALRELVACRQLWLKVDAADAIETHGADNWSLMKNDYDRRVPLAWVAARRALGQGEAK